MVSAVLFKTIFALNYYRKHELDYAGKHQFKKKIIKANCHIWGKIK